MHETLRREGSRPCLGSKPCSVLERIGSRTFILDVEEWLDGTSEKNGGDVPVSMWGLYHVNRQ